jgi:hypothetical protein
MMQVWRTSWEETRAISLPELFLGYTESGTISPPLQVQVISFLIIVRAPGPAYLFFLRINHALLEKLNTA